MMRPWLQQGYPVVALFGDDGLQRRTFVHILVCEAFVGPKPSPLHEVAHADGVRDNPHFTNLRWATHVENEADKAAHGTKPVGEKHGSAKLTTAQVLEIRRSPERQCDLADKFGVSRAQICLIKKGRTWRHAA